MVTLLQYTFQALCHLLTEEKTGTQMKELAYKRSPSQKIAVCELETIYRWRQHGDQLRVWALESVGVGFGPF